MNFDDFIRATATLGIAGTEAIPVVQVTGLTKQTTGNAILALGAQYPGGTPMVTGGTDITSFDGNKIADAVGQLLWPTTAQLALDSAGNLWNQQGTLIADGAGNIYWPGSSGTAIMAAAGGQLNDSGGALIADATTRYFGPNVWQDSTTSPGSAFQILTSAGPGQPVKWANPPGAQSFQVPLSGSGVSIGSSPTVLASTGVIGFLGDLWMFVATVTVINTVSNLGDLAISIRDSGGTTYAAGLTSTVASTNYTISLTALLILSGPTTIDLVAECPSGSPFVSGDPGGSPGTSLTAVHLA